MAGPPKPIDREAEFKALQKEEQAVREGTKEAQGAPPSDTGGWLGHGDPYERAINKAAEYLPERLLPKTGNSPGAWARWAGGMLIPQNAPEAAIAALTLPLGGPLFSTGTKIGAKVAGKVVPQMIKRAVTQGAKTGATAAGVSALTGHDPLSQGALGAIGGGLGQAVGDIGGAALQSTTAKRILSTAGDRLKEFSAGVFKNIPAAANAKAALTDIITGNNAKKLEQDILNLGARYQRNPTGFDPRLDTDIMQYATVAQGRAGANAGDVFKRTFDPATNTHIYLPQLREVWKYGTPEVRKALIDKGYIGAATPGFAGTYNTLAKEAKDARLIQQWLTGEADPNKITQEMIDKVTKQYFTPDMQLTAEGLVALGQRYATFRPVLERQLGKPAADKLEQAIFHDVSHGLQRGVTGEGASVGLTLKPPFVEVRKPGVLTHVPGWEQEAGKAGAEKAIQALTPGAAAVAAPLPVKMLERPAPPAPLEEKAPPPTPYGTPPAADTSRRAPPPAVEPPPPGPPAPPAGWFPPAAEPDTGGGTPWFNQPPAPPPTLTGEPAKPGLSLELGKAED